MPLILNTTQVAKCVSLEFGGRDVEHYDGHWGGDRYVAMIEFD